jgi:hypothetical protein
VGEAGEAGEATRLDGAAAEVLLQRPHTRPAPSKIPLTTGTSAKWMRRCCTITDETAGSLPSSCWGRYRSLGARRWPSSKSCGAAPHM